MCQSQSTITTSKLFFSFSIFILFHFSSIILLFVHVQHHHSLWRYWLNMAAKTWLWWVKKKTLFIPFFIFPSLFYFILFKIYNNNNAKENSKRKNWEEKFFLLFLLLFVPRLNNWMWIALQWEKFFKFKFSLSWWKKH